MVRATPSCVVGVRRYFAVAATMGSVQFTAAMGSTIPSLVVSVTREGLWTLCNKEKLTKIRFKMKDPKSL